MSPPPWRCCHALLARRRCPIGPGLDPRFSFEDTSHRHRTLGSFPPSTTRLASFPQWADNQGAMRKPSACSTCRYVCLTDSMLLGPARCPLSLANHTPGHEGANAYTRLQPLDLEYQYASTAYRVDCAAYRRLQRVAITRSGRQDSRKPLQSSNRHLHHPENNQCRLPANLIPIYLQCL